MSVLRHVRRRRACARRLVLESLSGLPSAPLVTAAETGLAPHRVVRIADKLAGSSGGVPADRETGRHLGVSSQTSRPAASGGRASLSQERG